MNDAAQSLLVTLIAAFLAAGTARLTWRLLQEEHVYRRRHAVLYRLNSLWSAAVMLFVSGALFGWWHP